jgi:hypothetical protein
MTILKHQLSLTLRLLILSIVCTIIQLNAQSQLTQLGPNKLTFASNAYFGENGLRWSRKSGHKIKPKFVSFYGKEKQKASTEV